MRSLTAALAIVLLLGACGSNATTSGETKASASPVKPSATPTEPNTLAAAKALAVESGARFGAQDFGGSWDQWNTAGKAAIKRDDYVKYATTCDLGGMPLKVDNIRLEPDGSAIVRYEVLGFKQARTLVYEDGHWRAKVTDNTLKMFADGPDRAVATARADGSC